MVTKVMHSEYSICEDLDMACRDNERIWNEQIMEGHGSNAHERKVEGNEINTNKVT